MKYVEVRNLKYNNECISFVFFEKWNSFYGVDNDFLSILMGTKEYDGYININGNFLKNNNLSDKIYCVNKNDNFLGINLYDELLMSGGLVSLIDDYIIYFGLSEYKYLSFDKIPLDKKIIASILFGVLNNKKYIYLNNVLCFLSKKDRDCIYSFLIKNNIIVFNFTTNPEELIYSSKVLKLFDYSIYDVKDISDIKIIDLCNRLIDYGLLNDKYINIEEVVCNL